MNTPAIRPATAQETSAIRALYPLAFPEEDLLPLLSDLLGRDDVVSLVAEAPSGDLTGHAAFTICTLPGSDAPLALLGPVAIAPEHQHKGIGTALIRDGFARMTDAGMARVFVLGDPAYYSRLGFTAETSVLPPHKLPEEWDGAWQSIRLGDEDRVLSGTLQVPPPWQPRTLWAP